MVRRKAAVSKAQRSWIELDFAALRNNVSELRRIMHSGCRILAIVKDEGYGHGAYQITKELQKLGVDYILVEADRICRKTSGNTTAKITSQHGLVYADILKKYGAEVAEKYYLINEKAIEEYAGMCGEIDCGCVIQMPCKRENCAMKPLTRFDAAVDFSDHSPLYGKHEVTLEDLRGLPCIGMGSLEKTLVPLWEDCRGKGISLDYQPISSTVDAFYQIQHGLAVGFDILKTEVPDYDPSRCARLTGYAFEIGFLCADRCTDTSALEVFCAFFARECTDRWNKHREEWNVQAKP